jgi:hypothetical protein
VTFKHEMGADRPHVFERTFGLAATIKDGKKYVSGQIERPPDKFTLFPPGRELQDTKRMSRLRLQPGSFVMVWVDEPTPVLIQSMKCLRIAPKPINFKVLESSETFQIEFLGGDLIDQVRVRVANRFECDPTQVQLWFTEYELLDDVMIEAIGLGDDGFIGIQIRPADIVRMLREFGNSLSIASADVFGGQFPEADVLSIPAPSVFEQVTPEEIKLIRSVIAGSAVSEDDAILQFIDVGRRVDRLQVRLGIG